MILLDDFYKITETSTARYKVKMNGAHTIYKVHFTDNPVTPGVCLVQMVTELLQVAYGKCLQLVAIPKIKYRNAVKPNDEPLFEFSDVKIDDKEICVCANIQDASKRFAQMVLIYKAENA